MFRYLAVLLISLSSLASQAQAATWYGFNKNYTNTALYYFDLDTVSKQTGTVTIWIKYVNDQTVADSDGSYATAQKMIYGCAKRNVQALTSVIYDKNGNFIKTYPNAEKVTDVIPGSVGEGILKVVCSPDFPKNMSSGLIFKVENNDIFSNTAKYFDNQRAEKYDPAPK